MIQSGSSHVVGRSISIACAPATRRCSASGPPVTSFNPSSSWPRRSRSRNAEAAAWSLILVECRNYRTRFVEMLMGGAAGVLQSAAMTTFRTSARSGIRSPTWGSVEHDRMLITKRRGRLGVGRRRTLLPRRDRRAVVREPRPRPARDRRGGPAPAAAPRRLQHLRRLRERARARAGRPARRARARARQPRVPRLRRRRRHRDGRQDRARLPRAARRARPRAPDRPRRTATTAPTASAPPSAASPPTRPASGRSSATPRRSPTTTPTPSSARSSASAAIASRRSSASR